MSHCCDDPNMCTFSDGCCEDGCICRDEEDDDEATTSSAPPTDPAHS